MYAIRIEPTCIVIESYDIVEFHQQFIICGIPASVAMLAFSVIKSMFLVKSMCHFLMYSRHQFLTHQDNANSTKFYVPFVSAN
jgi:hypothetical protein